MLKEQCIQDSINESYGIMLHCIESWCNCFTVNLIQNNPLCTSYSIEDIVVPQDLPQLYSTPANSIQYS